MPLPLIFFVRIPEMGGFVFFLRREFPVIHTACLIAGQILVIIKAECYACMRKGCFGYAAVSPAVQGLRT